MQLSTLRKQITAVLVIFVLAQGVVLTLLYSRIRPFAQTGMQLIHSHDVRDELHALQAALIDMETGERAFVITGMEEFLQPYRASLRTVGPRLEYLRTLIRGSAVSQSHLDALSSLVETSQKYMAQVIETRRHQGFEPAQRIVVGGAPKQTMEQIRRTIAEMDNAEQQLTRSREREYLRSSQFVVDLAFFGFGGILLLTVILGFFLLNRLLMLAFAVMQRLAKLVTGLRATATASARDATQLAALAEAESTANAERQATLDLVTRMARDLTVVATEIAASVRVLAEGMSEGNRTHSAAEIERIVGLAARTGQSTLSIELTTSEQRRMLEASQSSGDRWTEILKNSEKAAASTREAADRLKQLIREFRGFLTRGRQRQTMDRSSLENIRTMTEMQ